MPKLACWSCGRQIHSVAALDSLDTDERRCPRCGAHLNTDRREVERRTSNRRERPADDPGPPPGEHERRIEERRVHRRRNR